MQKRIIVSILLSVLIILVSLGLVSYYHIEESIERSYDDRLAESRIIATSIDNILERNLTRLYDISLSDRIDVADSDWAPEQEALKSAYHYSIFTDGVFLLDKIGNVLLTYPPREGWSINMLGIPPVSKGIRDMRPVISSVFSMEPARRKVIFALVPLKDRRGDVIGTAGGIIDPTSYHFTRILSAITTDGTTNIELVDSLGIIIASNRPASILSGIDHNKFLEHLIAEKKSAVATCHRCHTGGRDGQQRTEDILVFAPLSFAPWGVALRFPKDVLFAPSDSLKAGFLLLGVVSLATSFVLALGMSKSIVKPVRQLIQATDRIARGGLGQPVDIESEEEIGTLSRSFEDMRAKLAASLESIQRQNVELEQRVQERTHQLEEKHAINRILLRKLIGSQENERKRIARELHDESLQTMSALLMNIEMCRLHPDRMTPDKLSHMKDTANRIIGETTKIIQNLRPTVLDDLGFEAAVVWIIEQYLKEKGIRCSLDLRDLDEDRLTPELQVTLFRIFQEVSSNIARHAHAEYVHVQMKNDAKLFTMTVEDDGEGFDTNTVFENTLTGRGLGILGMKERAAHVNGVVKVCSKPGQGTTVLCTVPLTAEG